MSLNFYSPFSPLDPPRVRKWLSENDFVPAFSTAHRLYYRVVRPWLPVRLRQRLQRAHALRRMHPVDFIDPEMVDWVYGTEVGRRILFGLYPSGYTWAAVLTHDVESGDGLRRVPQLIELEHRYRLRSSWNIVPFRYRVDQGILNVIRQAGHEVGVHGYCHDGRLFWSRQEFERRVRAINQIAREWGAVGFRAPMLHRNLEWMQQLDMLYDASTFDCDPYQPLPGGVKSIWPFMAGRLVELPYTLPQDHTIFIVLREKGAGLWVRKTRWLIEHHGMVLLVTHPEYLDQPARLAAYEEFLDFLAGQLRETNGWHVLPQELAQFWLRHRTATATGDGGETATVQSGKPGEYLEDMERRK